MKTADKIKVGAKVEVLLEKIENKFGDIVISAEKARQKIVSFGYSAPWVIKTKVNRLPRTNSR